MRARLLLDTSSRRVNLWHAYSFWKTLTFQPMICSRARTTRSSGLIILLQGQELIKALDGVQMLGIRSKTAVTREVIEACPELVAIGAYCIGTNQVDLETASDYVYRSYSTRLMQIPDPWLS